MGEGGGGHNRTVKVKRAVARQQCMSGLSYFKFGMSNHSSLSNACYNSIVSTRNKRREGGREGGRREGGEGGRGGMNVIHIIMGHNI